MNTKISHESEKTCIPMENQATSTTVNENLSDSTLNSFNNPTSPNEETSTSSQIAGRIATNLDLQTILSSPNLPEVIYLDEQLKVIYISEQTIKTTTTTAKKQQPIILVTSISTEQTSIATSEMLAWEQPQIEESLKLQIKEKQDDESNDNSDVVYARSSNSTTVSTSTEEGNDENQILLEWFDNKRNKKHPNKKEMKELEARTKFSKERIKSWIAQEKKKRSRRISAGKNDKNEDTSKNKKQKKD